jgi:hypothetical protein
MEFENKRLSQKSLRPDSNLHVSLHAFLILLRNRRKRFYNLITMGYKTKRGQPLRTTSGWHSQIRLWAYL